MPARNFKELLAWQKAMDYVVEVYPVARKFPREEMFALSDQLRRSAVSIPSNIAEGQGRGDGKDFIRFLRIALGSLQESETQIMIAKRLGYVTDDEIEPALMAGTEVARLTKGLIASLTTNYQLKTTN